MSIKTLGQRIADKWWPGNMAGDQLVKDELASLIDQEAAKVSEQPYGGHPDAEAASGIGSKEQPSTNQPDACQQEGCPHYGNAIKCEPKEGGWIATVPRQPVGYRPHPNTSLELRINNALARLNLDRLDIAELKDGETISRNIADDRWLAALLEDLRSHLMRESVVPSEKMCDAARWFILARDANIFTWGGLTKCVDVDTVIPHIRDKMIKRPTEHITKWDFAECVYILMNTQIEGGESC